MPASLLLYLLLDSLRQLACSFLKQCIFLELRLAFQPPWAILWCKRSCLLECPLLNLLHLFIMVKLIVAHESSSFAALTLSATARLVLGRQVILK